MAKLKKCAHCGMKFKPEKATQTYCCLECAEAAIAKQKQWNDVLAPVANVIELEYLTFSKVATLMGCSRQYVYKLVAEGKLPASRLSNRMSFIRKEDIEKMLQGNPYYRVLPIGMKKERKKTASDVDGNMELGSNQQMPEFDANKYITLEKAMATYSVSNTTIYNKVKSGNVPQCRISGKTYYNRQLLDEVMEGYKKSHGTHVTISKTCESIDLDDIEIVKDDGIEWILIKDCAALYHKTVSSMKTYAYRYEVPARWIDGKRYYSKTFLDKKLCHENDEEGYYTTSQLYNIYGIAKSTATVFCQKHGVRTKNVGRKTLFFKEDVDKVMAARSK